MIIENSLRTTRLKHMFRGELSKGDAVVDSSTFRQQGDVPSRLSVPTCEPLQHLVKLSRYF
jgi:hypothetical protein